MVRISVTAAFDGPARAIRCAVAIREQSRALGIDVRTGLHTGECERRGDDLAGIAVHIGARVAARAQAGEVLVTSTVRDLVAGSGIMFTDRGEQALKGVPAPWRLLAVDVGREVGPMTCPARGRENRAGLRFCEECDAALFALLCDLRR